MSKPSDGKASEKRQASPSVAGAYVRKKDRLEAEEKGTAKYEPEINIKIKNDDIEIPEDFVRFSKQTFEVKSKIPEKAVATLKGHTGVVNSLQWHPIYGHLLASSSLDHTARIWSVYPNKGEVFSISHTEGVKDVKWTCDGSQLLSGGLDSYVNLTDVETGKLVHSYKHKEWVTSICVHPTNPAVFLAGASKRGIVCWDTRTNRVTSEYFGMFGGVQDMCFLDSNSFVSSAEVVRRNSLDQGIIVWDLRSGARLSNQVYLEGYTCTCVRKHPSARSFVAQSMDDYIALFDSFKPYRMDLRKRYQGHSVEGYQIGLSFSKDGRMIVSGSSTGSLYFYDFESSVLLKSIKVFQKSACLRAEYHPLLVSTVAISSWGGNIAVLSLYVYLTNNPFVILQSVMSIGLLHALGNKLLLLLLINSDNNQYLLHLLRRYFLH